MSETCGAFTFSLNQLPPLSSLPKMSPLCCAAYMRSGLAVGHGGIKHIKFFWVDRQRDGVFLAKFRGHRLPALASVIARIEGAAFRHPFPRVMTTGSDKDLVRVFRMKHDGMNIGVEATVQQFPIGSAIDGLKHVTHLQSDVHRFRIFRVDG